MNIHRSQAARRCVRSEIRDLLQWTRRPGVISFGGGLPDPALFPIRELEAISREVLEAKGYLALQYGPTQGEPEFREALVAHMAGFGERASAEQICAVSSSQQALDLLGALFIDEGDDVVMEIPSYLGAIQSFRRYGARMHGVPLDDEGMRLDRLEATLLGLERSGRRPRFIYAIPDFQNPSGINLSLARRRRLLDLAREREIPVIEDSPYRELTFGAEPLPSLWTLAEGRDVIQLKTFSKMLFPGMRLGWIVAETEAIQELEKIKQSIDLCTSSFNQLIIARFLRQGLMHETIRRAIACYRPKRDEMLSALAGAMPAGVRWSEPQGGMFLWVVLPGELDAAELLAAAAERGVVYVVGRPFHCDASGANTLRLNYSFPTLEQIRTGIQRLGDVVRQALEKRRRQEKGIAISPGMI